MNIVPVLHPLTDQAKPFRNNYCALLPGKLFGMDWKRDKSCGFDEDELYAMAPSLAPLDSVMIAEEDKNQWLYNDASRVDIQMVARNYTRAVTILKQAGVKRVFDYGSGNMQPEQIEHLLPYVCCFDGMTPGAKLKGTLTQERDMRRGVNRAAGLRDALSKLKIELAVVPAVYHRREPDGIGGGAMSDETWAFERLPKAVWQEHISNLRSAGVEECLLQCQYDFWRMSMGYPGYPRKDSERRRANYLAREVRKYVRWAR